MAAQGEIGEARVHGGEVRRPSSSSSLVSLLLPLLSSLFFLSFSNHDVVWVADRSFG